MQRVIIYFVYAIVVIFIFSINVSAQTLGTGENIDPPITRLILGILMGIILVFASVFFIRRQGKFTTKRADKAFLWAKKYSRNSEIHVRETKRLNQNADICLIEQGSTEFLVLISAHQFLLLSEKDTKVTVTDTDLGREIP